MHKWKKKTPNKPPLFIPIILLLFFFVIILFIISYTEISKSLFSTSSKTLNSQFPQCNTKLTKPISREKFLWFAPHSGFSNQLLELKNAILMASILNRTLIVPPVLDHHAVALGSCPKFRVLDPKVLRFQVWNHTVELIRSRRYVSMASIVDLSSLTSSSMVKFVDFWEFSMFWCGLDINYGCLDASGDNSVLDHNLRKCGSFLSGLNGNVEGCLYALEDDCRTTVWTYQENIEDGRLDSFQPDEQLRKRKKVAYVRRRRDVYKALGPHSEAGLATVLAFGSLFTSPYKGSELSIDIHDASRDHRLKSMLSKLDSLPFVPEITSAGKNFVMDRIKAPFLCAQLRLLDGQFKNHLKSTFLGLKEKLEALEKNNSNTPIHIFVMTDLPESNWTNSYLGELMKRSDTYKLHNLQEGDKLVMQTSEKIAYARRGMQSEFIPTELRVKRNTCPPGKLPDILLYIEETICSCASLGFVGTSGSTIAESIELMRRSRSCRITGQSYL